MPHLALYLININLPLQKHVYLCCARFCCVLIVGAKKIPHRLFILLS